MKTTFKTIVIKSHEQTMDEFAAICDATIKGEKVAEEVAQYSFTSFEAFRKAMTPQRFALLKVIREKQPESIKELAAITQRDMKNISEDVKVLLEMDLIEMEKHGKKQSPEIALRRLQVGSCSLEGWGYRMNRDFKVKIETEEKFFADLIVQAEKIDQGIIPEKTVERVSFADLTEARRQGEAAGLKQSDITAAIAKVRKTPMKVNFDTRHKKVNRARLLSLRATLFGALD